MLGLWSGGGLTVSGTHRWTSQFHHGSPCPHLRRLISKNLLPRRPKKPCCQPRLAWMRPASPPAPRWNRAKKTRSSAHFCQIRQPPRRRLTLPPKSRHRLSRPWQGTLWRDRPSRSPSHRQKPRDPALFCRGHARVVRMHCPVGIIAHFFPGPFVQRAFRQFNHRDAILDGADVDA